jgi:hypothetical protein
LSTSTAPRQTYRREMRSILGACLAALALTGCITQIRRVPATWDHATAPECTTSYGWVAGDAALAALAVGTGLAVAENVSSRSESQGAAVAGGIVGLVFAIAAGIGAGWVDDCVRAKESLRAALATAH